MINGRIERQLRCDLYVLLSVPLVGTESEKIESEKIESEIESEIESDI